MSSHLQNSKKNRKTPLVESCPLPEPRLTTKELIYVQNAADGDFFYDDEEIKEIKLEDSEDPNSVLKKASVVLIIYFLTWNIAFSFIWYDVRTARQTYRSLNFFKSLLFSASFIVLVKILGSFFKERMKRIMKFLFMLDVIFSCIFVFTLYFRLEEAYITLYVYDSLYVILMGLCFFSSAIGFALSTFIAKIKYNSIMGIVIMTFLNVIVVVGFCFFVDSIMIRSSRIITVVIFMFFYNVYITFDAMNLIEFRAKHLTTGDSVHIFFCFFTDIFFRFWKESFKSIYRGRAKKQPGKNQQDIEANIEDKIEQDQRKTDKKEAKKSAKKKNEPKKIEKVSKPEGEKVDEVDRDLPNVDDILEELKREGLYDR